MKHIRWRTLSFLVLIVMMMLVVACSGSESESVASSDPVDAGDPSATVEASASSELGRTDESLAEMLEQPVAPFTNIAPVVLGDDFMIENRHPGVAIFDYDRDGDLDFYVTSAESQALLPDTTGGPNKLFRNDGDNVYSEVAAEAGVAAAVANSTGAAACDINNDGYQDLYVASYGRIGDHLDYRAARYYPGLPEIIKDRMFLNNRDGTFTEITDDAFGDSVNIRSGFSVACADVNRDGWIDIFVGNRVDQDFLWFNRPDHHGHYNVLYLNNGDNTFADVTKEAGLIYGPIVMRYPWGAPYVWTDPNTTDLTMSIEAGWQEPYAWTDSAPSEPWRDPESGEVASGYNPYLLDLAGERVGEPTGQTLAVLFFDHDNDGDPDLWLADDGSRLKVFRNDSTPSDVKFTQISRAMGIDRVGAWMGFALGDYDNDLDLDIFVTNIGYHPLTREAPTIPSGDCAYSHRYEIGTCFHFLLRNDGVREVPGQGLVGIFNDTAGSTNVVPSEIMPPMSTDPSQIEDEWQVPTGLAAYDFGFGTVFFDYENDGDQDLYWLGSMSDRGEGPSGHLFPGAGRMLRGNGKGDFQDITVEARLLDILGVDYSNLDPDNAGFDRAAQRISPAFHENGKGLAKGDLDGDGYVDLIGTNSNGCRLIGQDECSWDPGPLFMWMNAGGDSDWLSLRLIGGRAFSDTGSNADGIGSRIFIDVRHPDGSVSSQVQELIGSSTFLSMNSLEVNFGLGDAEVIESIRIKWPSGVEQVINDVQPNQLLEIREGETVE